MSTQRRRPLGVAESAPRAKASYTKRELVGAGIVAAVLLLFAFAYMAVELGGNPLMWVVLYFVATGAMLWYLVVTYRRGQAADDVAKRLGWRRRHAGLWRGIDALPVNTPAGMMASHPLSGVWRGHDAESAILSTAPGKKSDGGVLWVASIDVMPLPAPLPRMEIARKGSNRAAGRNPGDDVDVESPEFEDRFHIVSANREFAHAVLHPQMIERLLLPDARDLSLVICGNRILIWSTPPAKVEHLESRLNVLADVIDLLPSFIYDMWSTGGDRYPASSDGAAQAVVVNSSRKNWMGIVANICWLTLIPFVFAIIFGHLGLKAARRGEATNHSAAFVGLIGGYTALGLAAIGTVVVLAGGGS